MAAATNLVVGCHVWVENPNEAWIDGEVLEVIVENHVEQIKVLCTSGNTVVVKASDVFHKDTGAPSCGVDIMTKVAAANRVVGSRVWLKDPDVAWIDGEILEIKGEEIKVLCTSGKMLVVKASNVYHKETEAPHCGVEDMSMTKFAYLHEPGILDNLKSRYDIDEIYTYTGNILIAVNPFKKLPHLYDNHMMAKYKGAGFGELRPHPFAVADAAYRRMINERISQSILVGGESGAGKTDTTELLIRYLAYMHGRANAAKGRTVEQKLLEANHILEAFGNAKTVSNSNSSRFGKFVEIQFDHLGKFSGASIRTYLLERSRVCQVSDPERNYHCFYRLCAAPPEDVQKYKLGNPRTFHYLNQSNCYELEGVDEFKEYCDTRRAMDVVGISSEEQEAIFRVVAAILHLGNIEFTKGKEIDSSVPKDENSWFHLQTAAELFMCDAKALEDSLCKRVIVVGGGETFTKWLDPEAATLNRDALAKNAYTRLFDWLVNKINFSIGQDPDSKFSIGVLDIYGFESFKTNSFEQFCVNFTNEKLQQHFNQHVLKKVQEEYKNEEIEWSYIEFDDNQDVLDLIEKKPRGIIDLLDKVWSNHEEFARNLRYNFQNHKKLSKPKNSSSSDFTIHHSVGDVTYQTELFPVKIKDYVIAEHQEYLCASKFLPDLFCPLPEESSKQSKFSSIGSRLKQQLQALFETLNATEPHYIRCIKPNNILQPAIFENKNVLHQLRCGEFMKAIRISCVGYPNRKTFDEFVGQFGFLAPEALDGSSDKITTSKKILDKVGLEGYQIGRTKVFLQAALMADLDTRRNNVLGKSARIIQRGVRPYLDRQRFISIRLSAIQIQAARRGQLARRKFRELKMYIYVQVARETRALQAAKNKLEKQVEDLSLRLQLEKRSRIDMEEEKAQEYKKLQSALQEMQLQFEETNLLLEKEREATKKGSEKLTSDNKKLETLVSSLEKTIDETQKRFEEAIKISEERLKTAESEIIQLKSISYLVDGHSKAMQEDQTSQPEDHTGLDLPANPQTLRFTRVWIEKIWTYLNVGLCKLACIGMRAKQIWSASHIKKFKK